MFQQHVALSTVDHTSKQSFSSNISEDFYKSSRYHSLWRLSCWLPTRHDTTDFCILKADDRVENEIWKIVRSSPELFSFYISLTLQVHMTEFLSSRQQAQIVKRHASRELRALADMCDLAKDCKTQLDLLTPAVRGLFLIAYQGEEHFPTDEVDFDWSIPNSYYRILRASQDFESNLNTTNYISGDRIKVAFLSAYFFRHSVGRLMGNLILSLDKSIFDVRIFNAKKHTLIDDDITVKLKAGVSQWVDLSHDFDKDVAMIREQRVHILVFGDLMMNGYTAHLVSQRMSPIQIGFWGHPFSAGSPTIDYFISSDGFQESWKTLKYKEAVFSDYYEQVVLMDTFSANVLADQEYDFGFDIDKVFLKHHDLGNRYDYLLHLCSMGLDLRSRPCQSTWLNQSISGEYHVYTGLQSIMKMHPLFDEVIINLVKRDPRAVIILLSSMKSKFLSQTALQNRLSKALLQVGADPKRILFMPQISSTVYSQIVCGSDVTLDPIPYGGGVTLSDSIRCNVPFITSGEKMR